MDRYVVEEFLELESNKENIASVLKTEPNNLLFEIEESSEDNSDGFPSGELLVNIVDDGTRAFSITLSEFPGNCGIAVLSNMYLSYFKEDYSILNSMLDLFLIVMDNLQYSMILYSTSETQRAMEEALELSGFDRLNETEVENKNSGNYICLWSYRL